MTKNRLKVLGDKEEEIVFAAVQSTAPPSRPEMMQSEGWCLALKLVLQRPADHRRLEMKKLARCWIQRMKEKVIRVKHARAETAVAKRSAVSIYPHARIKPQSSIAQTVWARDA